MRLVDRRDQALALELVPEDKKAIFFLVRLRLTEPQIRKRRKGGRKERKGTDLLIKDPHLNFILERFGVTESINAR
jgi:hypothetical protein